MRPPSGALTAVMPPLLLVMAGGAIGAGARHLVGRAALGIAGSSYPWGTLVVNLLGGFGMGLLAGVLARMAASGGDWRLFIGVGLLGGFTTFSAFSLDMMVMIERGDWPAAAGYALISVIGALAALFAGLSLVRALA